MGNTAARRRQEVPIGLSGSGGRPLPLRGFQITGNSRVFKQIQLRLRGLRGLPAPSFLQLPLICFYTVFPALEGKKPRKPRRHPPSDGNIGS